MVGAVPVVEIRLVGGDRLAEAERPHRRAGLAAGVFPPALLGQPQRRTHQAQVGLGQELLADGLARQNFLDYHEAAIRHPVRSALDRLERVDAGVEGEHKFSLTQRF